MQKLPARIARRGALPAEELQHQLKSANKELLQARFFDYQVWSLENKIPACVAEVEKIILERCAKNGVLI